MIFKKTLTCMLIFILLINVLIVSAAFADDIDFACDNLKAALSEIIGKDNITISDMRNISGKLDLSYKNITCLEGMQYLDNVETLILSYNNISDITPLLALGNLEMLFLNDNWISTLPQAQSLTSLEHLDIGGNAIETIPPTFIDMPSLKRLYLNNLPLVAPPDMIKIRDTLKRLDVSGTFLLDYTFVENLVQLELLMMNNNKMTLLPDLSKITQLGYLYFTHNNIGILPDYMGNLPLVRLDFSYNDVQTLPESFSRLQKLEHLVFTGNYFRFLPDVVPHMSSLEVLMCGQNIIEDVPENMADLVNVKRASFVSNNLRTLEKFRDFSIPYSYQISFDLNYINLFDQTNIDVLQKYRNTGGVQKTSGITVGVTNADTQSVEMLVIFDENEMALLPETVRYYELRLYEADASRLVLKSKIDLTAQPQLELVISDVAHLAGQTDYLVCLVMQDTAWLPTLIKYTAQINDVDIKQAVTITATPIAVQSATPLVSASPSTEIVQEDKYLLYILLLGVIMIVLAVIVYVMRKRRR